MKDGDTCPECGCGTMFLMAAYLTVLRCSWCYAERPMDIIERPRRKDLEPSQKRL